MATGTKRKKKSTTMMTQRIRPVKQGRTTLIPIPTKMLKALNFKSDRHLFWTVIDGVLQLSIDTPVMVISVLDRPESKFEAQSG